MCLEKLKVAVLVIGFFSVSPVDKCGAENWIPSSDEISIGICLSVSPRLTPRSRRFRYLFFRKDDVRIKEGHIHSTNDQTIKQ